MAVDAAVAGDEVVLQAGTYTGDGNRDIDFLGKAITVRGATGDANDCIIDCQGTEAEPHRGFKFVSGENTNSVLESLTVKNGYGPQEDPDGNGHFFSMGGAVYCHLASPTINNCVFINNACNTFGSGIYNYQSNAVISNCIFAGNSGSSGGGICNWTSNVIISNCDFENNSANNGAGIYNHVCSPEITKCTFINNNADLYGGGGITNHSSNPDITGCVFFNNSANRGGGIYNSSSVVSEIVNCSFINNTASSGGGIYNGSYYCRSDLESCIVWNNIPNQISGSSTAVYSDIEGGFSGEGNINVDPEFVDSYHISATSPCIDSGIPNYVAEPGETDIDGDPRVMVRIDMGADEVSSGTSPLLIITPGILDFEVQGLSSPPQPQYVSIRNYGAEVLNWQISEPSQCDWLSVFPAMGQVYTGESNDVEITVNLNTAGYGTHSCQLQVTAPDAENSPQVVTVNLEVLGPQVGVNNDYFYFTAYGKSDPCVAGQELVISNTGFDTLNWHVEIPNDCNWLSVSPAAGQVTDGNSVIMLTVDPNKAAEYGYNYCTFNIVDANASNSPVAATARLTVYGPSLHVSPRGLQIYTERNTKAENTFEIRNTGYDVLHWQVEAPNDCNWLEGVEPLSGECTAGEADTVTVRVDANGLDDNVYRTWLSIQSPESQAWSIEVSLVVYSPNDIHVPGDYPTIQAAIDAAAIGDVIIVHPGKYAGFYVDKPALTIQSIEPENAAIIAATIIETAATIGEWTSGVDCVSVRGFSFTRPCPSYFYPGLSYAIKLSGGSAVIENCVVKNLSYDLDKYYSGLVIIEQNRAIGKVLIKNCLISCNYKLLSMYQRSMPAIEMYNASAEISNCTIAYNLGNLDGDVTDETSGLLISASDVVIENTILWGNVSDYDSQILIYNASTEPNPENSEVIISNCNVQGGINGVMVFPDPNQIAPGTLLWDSNNIDVDPCFVRAVCWDDNNTPEDANDDLLMGGDYHLKSAAGRWEWNEFIDMDAQGDGFLDMRDFAVLAEEWQKTSAVQDIPGTPFLYYPYLRADIDNSGVVDVCDLVIFCGGYLADYNEGRWVYDDVNSACIDAGDPEANWTGELWPHGKRVNMGAYGGTAEASMSMDESGNIADMDGDDCVNFVDFAEVGRRWGEDIMPMKEDLDGDGVVGLMDVMIFSEEWLGGG